MKLLRLYYSLTKIVMQGVPIPL
ncbi:hypothetical protein CMALT430_40029 [Carnobacterium maltaromaticum]|nr:hypothetical protein CMALT430_40029 [Carnobacterium maltaromaticum]